MSFLDTWNMIHEYFLEAHQEELTSKHGGDVRKDGFAPGNCSYCDVLLDHQHLTETAAVPTGKRIECRGRNGWFFLQQADVSWTFSKGNEKILTISIASKSGYINVAPIFLQGDPDAIEHLLLYLLLECGKVRASINQVETKKGVEAPL